ncbi:MAG: ABC transporter permease [Verrucomicrobia bacterium]|nr:ABC transporter permease [Verrucomicrobiota bacterium]
MSKRRLNAIRLTDILLLAISSLGANKLRSSLTVLGITIGVFSVVGVMTALSAIRNSIDESLSFLGANVFQIARQPPIQTGGTGVRWWQRAPLSPRDAERFERLMAEQLPGIAVTRFAMNNGERLRFGDRRTGANISVYGTNENFILTNKYEIELGRNLSSADLEFNRPVAVIGTAVVDSLFPNIDPIGREIIIRGDRFEVVGVLAERGEIFGSSLDNITLIPINRFVARHWNWRRSMDIAVQASSPEALAFEQDIAIGLMRLTRGLKPGEDNDFEVFSNDSLQAAFANIAKIVGAAALESVPSLCCARELVS